MRDLIYQMHRVFLIASTVNGNFVADNLSQRLVSFSYCPASEQAAGVAAGAGTELGHLT